MLKLKVQLEKLKGKAFTCPCLGGVPVVIDKDSIDEIAQHASKKYESTIEALKIDKAINKSRFVRMTLPKNNRRQKKMKLIFMYVLEYTTSKGGNAKITIGVSEKPLKFLQYCLTVQE